MSLMRHGLQLIQLAVRNNVSLKAVSRNHFQTNITKPRTGDFRFMVEGVKQEERRVTRNRKEIIPVEVSIEYMQSEAYKKTYGNDPVWTIFQRNFGGHRPPRRTRKTCIRNGIITTSSPCPICRDEFLVVDYRNTALLEQFLSEQTGEILEPFRTNVCRRKHNLICIAVLKAKDYGLLKFDVPIRHYNYAEWYDICNIHTSDDTITNTLEDLSTEH